MTDEQLDDFEGDSGLLWLQKSNLKSSVENFSELLVMVTQLIMH